jgi:hypothetical protein
MVLKSRCTRAAFGRFADRYDVELLAGELGG